MTDKTEYRVLARKYRPTTFADLVGQEALVRTLKNAIETNRIAQAYILTGIRGVGKTTSARIIARALNCVGPDGKGGMTTQPCGVCEHCRAIAEDRHVDVVEIDAASNTGVANVREIIETTRYNPTSARFKIYIIDEVHMLSTAAFNALLKTLEEPPERVKFIFATTEIRKVPTTVLSRCQRFDLRRVEPELLTAHFKNIVQKENVAAEEEALKLIARAADGSVRDGLSLLDQAIAHGGGNVTAEFVRAMIGLANRAAVVDLYEQIMKGEIKEALESFSKQYASGADPTIVLQDLLELTHWLTRVKIAPELADDGSMAAAERQRCTEMAEKLPMSVLTRTWQMLLKGIDETLKAPSEKQAAEMVLIRLAYAADLPTPGDMIKEIKSGGISVSAAQTSAAPSVPPAGSAQSGWSGVRISGNTVPAVQTRPQETVMFNSLADIAAYAYKQNEMMFAYNVENYVSLVSFEQGKIEFFPMGRAPNNLAGEMVEKLRQWTGRQWVVTVVSRQGGQTLIQQARTNAENLKKTMTQHPLVTAVLKAFPGARIDTIRLQKEEENESEDYGYETDSFSEAAAQPNEGYDE
ncbi:MAG: DNA polymerase III subunit gamma/tau [Alphaproteobacteria bacterium]|nr:DNA polymerase III subunit gamma/tau [Alphaproteobacteria bacterium]